MAFGEGGDFSLVGGTDPTDWEYAQHGPAFFSANTTGVFSLGVMDNGDDRIFPTGVTCGDRWGTSLSILDNSHLADRRNRENRHSHVSSNLAYESLQFLWRQRGFARKR